MAVDGHLNFDTKIDEKGFSSGVSRLGKIAKGGLGVLGAAVGGVATAMGAGITLGLKYNSSMENYFTNFQTMLGSADAATQHVADLKEFASKTPFEMSDLAQASQTLLSFGTDVSGVMPKLQQLGDVSLGNKEKFSSLALVYGQVASQGRLMGQDLMQCINAGFNPLQVISDKTGESMESLKEKMSKGEIGIEEFDQALQWATEDGGKFAGGMEAASQTFSGLMSTLKDNAMSLIGEVVQPISDSMTANLLPAALNAVEQMTTAFRENGAEGLIEAGASIITNILLGITNMLPTLIETTTSFITSFINSILISLPQLVQAGVGLADSLINGVASMLPMLLSAGIQVVGSLISGITSMIPNVLVTIVNLITNLLQELAKSLPMVLDLGINLILSLVQGLMKALPSLISYIPTIIETICSGILSKLPEILERGIDILNALINGIINAIPSLVSAIPSVISAFLNTIVQNLPQIIDSGFKLLQSLIRGIINAIPNLIAALPQVIKSIINAFKNVDWLSLGKNIILGIARGITGSVGALIDSVKNAAHRALEAAKKKLGINSPSRVFRDQVGKYMAQGIGVGFEDNMPISEMEKNLDDAVARIQASTGSIDANAPIPVGTKNKTFGMYSNEKESKKEIHIHTDLDGRELAHKIVPMIDDEMGTIAELKERGL